jgi:catechol 2,3-dioxygenase-like lactoylglutathione lyase family enzyme
MLPAYLEHAGIGVPTNSFEETLRFYETRLGLRRVGGRDLDVVLLAGPSGGVLEVFRTGSELAPPHLGFVLASKDWATTLAGLHSEASLEHGVRRGLGGRRYAAVHDPAGNLCQLFERGADLSGASDA